MKWLLGLIVSMLFSTASVWAAAASPGCNCPDLTTLQRAVGHISLENFVWTLAVLGIAGGILLIFDGVVRSILSLTGLMEKLLWALSIGLIVGAHFLPSDYQSWAFMIGSLLFPAAVSLSAYVRKVEGDPMRFSALLMVVWACVALFYQSSGVGFLAIGALVSLLGFSIIVTPFCYSFGFEREASIPRATAAGLIVMALYVLDRVTGLNSGPLMVFESGALWLGSFVGFIGLLILSNRWYSGKGSYTLINVVAAVILVISGAVAAAYGIRELTTMSGAFLLFYGAEKVIEVETRGKLALGAKVLVIGFIFFGVWQWIHTHQAALSQYLMA